MLGTQRPDASRTLHPTVKAQFASNIALKVKDSNNSKLILGESGAEKLLGSGDMLIKLSDMSEPKHILGVYVKF